VCGSGGSLLGWYVYFHIVGPSGKSIAPVQRFKYSPAKHACLHHGVIITPIVARFPVTALV
jgi:hypothetical protein